MNSRPRRSSRCRVTAIVGALSLAGGVISACGSTTYDTSITTTTFVATTTTIPTGTTEDLLRRLTTAMNGLSVLIGPDSSGRSPGGKTQQLGVIEALWDAARLNVTETDPDAADAIGRMVALARTAVERSRPADADKAARFAGQVIEDYLTSA